MVDDFFPSSNVPSKGGKNKHVLVVREWFTRRRSLFLLVPKWGGGRLGVGVGVGAGTESSKRCLLKKERRERK